MNKAFLTVGLLLLGILSLLLINVISNYSTGGEVDFYLLKETASAAMEESLDPGFKAMNGVPRMDKEIFMESFIRRFADNVDSTRNYVISFYGINEVPPSIGIKVNSATALKFQGERTNIVTTINEIVETTKTEDKFLSTEYGKNRSYIGEEQVVNARNEVTFKRK
ncbi:MAG: hypothetical protein IJI43_04435 [Bacilli bacterium]|nr:hypothetical protein [Bacilli bacterium]